MRTIRDFVLCSLIAFVPSLFLWLPFILRLQSIWGIPLPQEGMATIVANYDGPLYIVVAKTLYNASFIKANYFFTLPTQYYAAHFPLFPLLIRAFSPIFGYLYSMLFVTQVSTVIAVFYFHKFIKEFVGKNAFFVTLVFCIFPARFLISHSVGSADPLFEAAIIASVYHFRKDEFLKAGIWGAVAQFTKSPAILLFAAYFLYLVHREVKKIIASPKGLQFKPNQIVRTLPILLIPISLLGVFLIFQKTMGNFFAYFNSGDNIHLFFPPFQIFNFSLPWVGTSWLEEIIFVYLILALGLIKLIKQKESVLAWFTGIFFLSILFVSHRDLIRYALPMVPFLFAGYSKELVKSEVKYVLLFLIIPIYLFSLAFISQNVMPISDWAPFL